MKPLVSIGVPLFNAENHITKLKDLWKQSYPQLEVIVSDNGSDDRTVEMVRKVLCGKKKVSFLTSAINHGLAWNFNRVFRAAKGKYFMWASLDDRRNDNFVEKCVKEMEKHQDAALALPAVNVFIQNQPGCLYVVDVKEASRHRGSLSRYAWVLDHFPAVGLYGFFRTSVLAQTKLMAPFPGGDLPLIDELALLGRIIHVSGTKFHYFGRSQWNCPRQDCRVFTGKMGKSLRGFAGVRISLEKVKRLQAAKVPCLEKCLLSFVLAGNLLKTNFLRAVKNAVLLLPGPLPRNWLLEKLYWLGFHNSTIRIKNRELFRTRVVFPVMGLKQNFP